MKPKKLALLIFAIAFSLCMSGCTSPFSSISSLMSPPKFSGELTGIEQALESAIKSEYSFIYPSNGDYRSSCIYRDFDGDKQKEAIVFYSITNENPEVHFNFLRRESSIWKSVYDAKIACTAIDKIEFADVCGDGALELLIGMNMYTANENQLNVYKISGETIETVMQESYTSFSLCNLTGAQKNQILLMSIGNETVVGEDDSKSQTMRKLVLAKLVSLNEKGSTTSVIGTVELDSQITSFSKVSGDVVNNCGAAYIDAYKGSEVMITELIYFKNNMLVNAFYDAALGETTATKRENLINSTDVDHDGKIEIPESYLFPGQTNTSAENKVYYTVWKRYDGAAFHTVASGVYNAVDGYFLGTPESWIGSVWVERNTSKRLRIFYEWDFHKNSVGNELFRIQVFPKSAWEKDKHDGFVQIINDGDKIYAVKFNKSAKSAYSLSYDYIKSNFTLE